jgi:membrane protein implicated in regulation of membrane protease activity
MGLFIGGMVAWIFHILRNRIPAGMTSPDDLVGLLATIEIPVKPDVRGKIRVQIQDGSREIPARTNDNLDLQVGDAVMIVGMEGNLAWVVAEKTLRDES